MNYSDFRKHVETSPSCLYETIYDDSEGRQILVLRLLDAYVMVQNAVQEERKACEKVCEDIGNPWALDCAAAIRSRT